MNLRTIASLFVLSGREGSLMSTNACSWIHVQVFANDTKYSPDSKRKSPSLTLGLSFVVVYYYYYLF